MSFAESRERQAVTGPARILATAGFYAVGVLAGIVMFLAAFPAGVLSSIEILFYRGLAVLVVITIAHAAVILLALRWLRRSGGGFALRRGHVVPVVTVAAAINLAFFVLVPVNLDRAISVFLLSWMEQQGGAAVTQPELEQAFQETYVARYRAMDRRVSEQIASGNIEATPEGFRLTERGLAFVTFARAVGAIFSVDQRFLYPPREITKARQRQSAEAPARH